MKIIPASVEFAEDVDGLEILLKIEKAGRTCYKSEEKITGKSAVKFAENIIKNGHDSVLERAGFTARFVCDRGVSHEIVRHRMASYCQESTRYCNYGKGRFGGEITVIKPSFLDEGTKGYEDWFAAMLFAENAYFNLLDFGLTAQEARSVLPNSLKTELVMTANIREWRHFFKMRCAPAAHPQMREIACKLLKLVQENIPILFDDILVGGDANG